MLHLLAKVTRMNNIINNNSDAIGMWSSGLCLIHCLATPFLFVAKSCSTTTACCAAGPTWWGLLDVGFLVISFIAIYFTAKHSSKDWVKIALFVSWAALAGIILNEYLAVVNLTGYVIYAPAVALIGLHFYNRQYCQCTEDACNTDFVPANA